MSFPEQINLPYNFSMIKNDFTPGQQQPDQPAEAGYWIIIQGNSLVLKEKNGLLCLLEGDLPAWLTPLSSPIFIGNWKGKPLRAFNISSSQTIDSTYTTEMFTTVDIRMDFQIMTLGGLAKQILHWIGQSGHCSRCGSLTEPVYGTWGRKCSGCKAEHYPHIHPCAIILVKRGDQVMLTRKAEWIPGRYSLVAGFVDFGESLEECAVREVFEETGIRIENVRYTGSQNRPFPAQMMAGFVADYAGGEISVNHNELEDAQWFNVNQLPILPPKRSIARHIIDTYAV